MSTQVDAGLISPGNTVKPGDAMSWRTWFAVALCSVVYFLDGLLPAMLGPLAPNIAQSLNLGPAELGPVFSGTIVGQAIGLVIVPMFARYIGHKNIIILSVIGFGFMQAATYFVQAHDVLISIRILEGFFIGGGYPSCIVIVTAIVPQKHRGIGVMLLFVGLALGSTMAGVVSRWFVTGELWRTAFAITGLATMCMALVVWKFLNVDVSDTPEEPDEEPRKFRDIGKPPLLWGTLLLWLIYTCSFAVFYCITYWMPSMLVGLGRSPEIAAYAAASFNFGGLIALLMVGLLIDRYGAIRILSLAYLLAAVLFFFDGRFINELGDMPLLILLATTGFFILGGYAGVNVVLVSYYPAELRGLGAGWAKGVGRVINISTPVLIGIALARGAAEQDLLSMFALPAGMVATALLAIGYLKKEMTTVSVAKQVG